ncbi:MAG: T9SS type A sorting domain-containing protein [Fimbriimonadaceae bacterium]|nr:T9SS type A sorting domain-containing protein [Chitinophagales bacterium]
MRQLFILFLAISFQSVSGQQYDSTFNGNGFVTGAALFDGINMTEDPADILYETSTGKLIMLNQYNGGGSTLLRFNSDGAYDAEFGGDGIEEYPFINTESFINIFQNGDGYRLTGRNSPEFDTYSPFLKEINADGSINTVFGDDGINTVYGIDSFIVKASCKGSSGRIILVGYEVDWDIGAGIMAFNPDGSYDASFGYNNLEGFNYSYYRSVMELPDGRILVAGEVQFNPGEFSSAMIMCLLADGSLDETFGVSGFLFPELAFAHNQFVIEEITLSEDGNIYGAGFVSTPGDGTKEMIIKFNDSGELIAEFGDGGYYFLDSIIAIYPVHLVTDISNNLYLMEVSHPEGDATDQTIIHKILPNGEPDFSFSNGVPGEFLIQIPGMASYYEITGKQMIIQPDGKLVVVGKTDGLSANDDFFIGRIITNEAPTAIEEHEIIKTVSVFPNPATEFITIESERFMQSLEILSSDGKIVFSSQSKDQSDILDVKNLIPGFYLLHIQFGADEFVNRYFVKD